MSSNVLVTSVLQCTGVPRLSDAALSLTYAGYNEYETREFFCPEGHDFVLHFADKVTPPPLWECPTCETVAIDFPPNVTDEDFEFDIASLSILEDIFQRAAVAIAAHEESVVPEEVDHEYVCNDGHRFSITFLDTDYAPEQWTCMACGEAAVSAQVLSAIVVN